MTRVGISLFLKPVEHLPGSISRPGARYSMNAHHKQKLGIIGRHQSDNKTIPRGLSYVRAGRRSGLCQSTGSRQCAVDRGTRSTASRARHAIEDLGDRRLASLTNQFQISMRHPQRRNPPARAETGEFGAMMEVELVNDGPVTLWLEK